MPRHRTEEERGETEDSGGGGGVWWNGRHCSQEGGEICEGRSWTVTKEKISRREGKRTRCTRKGWEGKATGGEKKREGNGINKQINLCYVLDVARGRVTCNAEKKGAERSWSGRKREKGRPKRGVGGSGGGEFNSLEVVYQNTKRGIFPSASQAFSLCRVNQPVQLLPGLVSARSQRLFREGWCVPSSRLF